MNKTTNRSCRYIRFEHITIVQIDTGHILYLRPFNSCSAWAFNSARVRGLSLFPISSSLFNHTATINQHTMEWNRPSCVFLYIWFVPYVRVHSLFRSIGGDIHDLVYGCVQVLAKLPRRCERPALEINVIQRVLMQGTTGWAVVWGWGRLSGHLS